MQVYKNFDIGTAKPTPSELASVPHHLLGVVDFDEVYNAARFVKQCEDIAGQLNSRGVLPVIVGGTQMYIQSILWRSAVDVDEGSDAKFEEVRARLIKLSPPEAYQRLLEVDPLRARQLHPNDHRRVIRSLEVFESSGVLHSTIMTQQSKTSAQEGLRFNSCVLWLDCDESVLKERVFNRVDSMMKVGLLSEVFQLRDVLKLKRSGEELKALERLEDAQRGGIFQGIGYKEFWPIIKQGMQGPESVGAEELEASVNLVKANTFRLARRQKKWTRNKFILRQPWLPIVRLDSSDASKWDENVLPLALGFVEEFLKKGSLQPSPNDLGLTEDQHSQRANLGNRAAANTRASSQEVRFELPVQRFDCDLCNAHVIGEIGWRAHLKSRRHKHNQRGDNNFAANDGQIA
eukprot:GHVN01020823.1.p1 GENE.GHVN01020823.1~~GHVN01020823.1.p1  ORF type:complete len:404 (+),score=41.59 GHVN01020823.1:750-1961(+)